jgi:hypothetical protein
MILTEEEVTARYESPANLLNRLKTATSSRHNNIIPSLPPTANDVIEDLEDKLKGNSIKQKANTILLATLNELELRIPAIDKPESLSRVAESMNKIVSTENEKNGNGKGNRIGQIIIYAPEMMREDQFNVIDISHRE